MISQATIDEILMRTDIESLIGSYVSLKRAGTYLKGLCPFHSEKTPSFVVYPQDNSFYCFGCGVGGTAITFVRQMEHLDYPDAIEYLAKRAGITVVHEGRENHPNERYNKARLYQMNVDAAKFFHRALFEDTPKAKEALEYFTKKRNLSLATIKHFGLGYAPDSFDSLLNYMLKKGYTRDELVVGYLAGKSEKGNYYDAFRNRVMFPIIDVAGNVIAFGGRVMNDEDKPKYKNTMDTPVFKKSRNLFALNFAKNACSERLILCEGYMDVIALHVAGFTNAVATLGTAITPEQARLMSRYTKKVLICYDSDEAGQKATNKAMKLLSEVGLDVGVIKMSGAKDPDEYIKTYGKDKFSSVVNEAKSKFEFRMDSVLRRYDVTLSQDRINAIVELENIISEVYLRAERDIYIMAVSERLGVDAKSIHSDVEKLIKKRQRTERKNEAQAVHQVTAGYGDRVNPDYAKAPDVAKKEENVLGLLLLYPEHRKKVFSENILTEDSFYTNLGKRVFRYVKEQFELSEQNPTSFDESFSPEEVGRIYRMKTSRMQLENNGSEVLLESIESLKASIINNSAKGVTTIDDLQNLINSKKK